MSGTHSLAHLFNHLFIQQAFTHSLCVLSSVQDVGWPSEMVRYPHSTFFMTGWPFKDPLQVLNLIPFPLTLSSLQIVCWHSPPPELTVALMFPYLLLWTWRLALSLPPARIWCPTDLPCPHASLISVLSTPYWIFCEFVYLLFQAVSSERGGHVYLACRSPSKLTLGKCISAVKRINE